MSDGAGLQPLIEMARVGQRAGIEGLYHRLAGVAFTFAAGMLDNEERALTATEQAFRRALRAREDIPDEADLPAWLYRQLLHECRQLGHEAPARGLPASISPQERLNVLDWDARAAALLAGAGLAPDEIARIAGRPDPPEADDVAAARSIARRTPSVSLWAALERTLVAQRAMRARPAPRRPVPWVEILVGLAALLLGILLLVWMARL